MKNSSLIYKALYQRFRVLLAISLIPIVVSAQYPYFSGSDAANNTYHDCDFSTSSTIDVSFPVNVDANDILILQYSVSVETVPTTPEGWLLIEGKTSGFGLTYYTWWKRADGSEDGEKVTIVKNTGIASAGFISAWKGCVTSGTPYEDATMADIVSSNSRSTSSVTTQGSNRLVVAFTGIKANSHFQPVYGWNETDTTFSEAQYLVSDGNARTFSAHTYKMKTASVIGSFSAGWYTDVAGVLTLALKPASTVKDKISFEYWGAKEDAEDASTISVAYPSTVNENDILMMLVSTQGSFTINLPSGWTSISSTSTTTYSQRLMWKRAVGSETGTVSVSVNSGTPVLFAGQMWSMSGCIASGTPYESHTYETNNYGTGYEARAVTSTYANSLAVCIAIHDVAYWTTTAEGYIAEGYRKFNSGSDIAYAFMSKQLPAATTTNLTYGWSVTNHQAGAHTFVMIPAPDASGYPNNIDGMSPSKVDNIAVDAESKINGI